MNQSDDANAFVIAQLQQTNQRLKQTVELQLQTIQIVQERNQQLVEAVDLAIKRIEAANPNDPIARILKACL